jgi:C-terminal processing protease CtpA/Prc
LERRVAALEQALVIERDARQLLQEELSYLSGNLTGASDSLAGISDVQSIESGESIQSTGTVRRSGRWGRSRDPGVRRQRLVENGFSPQEADHVIRRESELLMASLQARYEARVSGERADVPDPSLTLRTELGDEAYGRYLEASGRPVTVTVSNIYEGSPALTAGLRPGDEIVRYDGSRVFNMSDISRLTLEGAPGENVIIEVTRDGVPMQLSIPRGPLGVSGGRRFR